MLVLWKRIEFYKGKSDCEVIVIAIWGLGQIPKTFLLCKGPFHHILLVCSVCLKESALETRKNVFYFTLKALFVLEIIKF